MHTKPVDVEWDELKAIANLHKHGVSFADAAEALRDPLAATLEDCDAEEEQRRVAFGCDALGRLLVVVYTERGARVRIISARRASRSEGVRIGLLGPRRRL